MATAPSTSPARASCTCRAAHWRSSPRASIGPRIGKYDKDGKVNADPAARHPDGAGSGTFILAFGWFGFNPGSSLAGTDVRIAIVAVNTMLAGMSATLSGVLYMWLRYGKPDPSMMCNGMLAGLVAITAPCAFVTPVGAFIIGAVAGVLVVSQRPLLRQAQDRRSGRRDQRPRRERRLGPHRCRSVLGRQLRQGWNGVGATDYLGVAGRGVTGLFYGDSKQLVAQLIETGVGIAWNVVVGGIAFYVIGKVLGSNRVSAEVEIAGLDVPEMGLPGYPEFVKSMAPEEVPVSDIEEAKWAIPALATASR